MKQSMHRAGVAVSCNVLKVNGVIGTFQRSPHS